MQAATDPPKKSSRRVDWLLRARMTRYLVIHARAGESRASKRCHQTKSTPPSPFMTLVLDREHLRARFRRFSDLQLRLVLERMLEHLPDAELETLLAGVEHLNHRLPAGQLPPSIAERVQAHAAATYAGEFSGKYVLRNAHGQRQPWQTAAWLAATSHLFEIIFTSLRGQRDEAMFVCLRSLCRLVLEVDRRLVEDGVELIVFEDDCAKYALSDELDLARALLEVDGHNESGPDVASRSSPATTGTDPSG